jgi:hypothetical protein
MTQIRQNVRLKTPRGRCHVDLREVIGDLNPILRGWGQSFGTGNAARSFNQLDSYVYERLRAREWIKRSKLGVETPRWQGARRAHTPRM